MYGKIIRVPLNLLKMQDAIPGPSTSIFFVILSGKRGSRRHCGQIHFYGGPVSRHVDEGSRVQATEVSAARKRHRTQTNPELAVGGSIDILPLID